ncbi:ARM repeat-containing protein [Daedalea quercina L-15889]|uniref:ARM repeat-containing protein n=1 Tax=Daedalea quercina L-15889 TaxID=1314783 RepID=A0A165TFN8_9APHY|nr:ARM repeat-containing protein [Daedalea quercina L-15889]
MAATLEQLMQCLTQTLSPDTTTRIKAELTLGDMLAAPEAGLVLAQLVASQGADVGLRQITSVVLRKFVNERWSLALPKWRGLPAVPVELKSQIRQVVFQTLSDPQSKIRSLSAQIITTIANADWPDEWPDLLDALIALLSSNSPQSVHGAMQVMAEFIKADLTEDQILPILRQLLPILLSILGAPEQHSVLTRARAVGVFRTCVETLFMVKQEHPQAVKEAAQSILPAWLDAFKFLLNLNPNQDVDGRPNWDGIALRIQIFKALDTIQVPFHRLLTPVLPDFLSAALTHLTTLYPVYLHHYVLAETAVPPPSEATDSESTELTQLYCAICDFVAGSARHARGREFWTEDSMGKVVLALVQWVQITKDDEDEWINNANAFVAQEAEEAMSFSVRIAGMDLLGAIIDGFQPLAMNTMQLAIQQVIAQSEVEKTSGNLNWWRPLEAMLASVGGQAESVLEWIEDEAASGRQAQIQIAPLLQNGIPNLLGLSDYPFLQGRAFVFASQYTKVLPVEMAGQYLQATVHVLEASEANIPIKISAVKAVLNFCKDINDDLLEPVAPRIAKAVGPFLSVTTEDTLSLVLEALLTIVEIKQCAWMTQDLASSLVTAVLDIWMKNNKDPIFISLLTDILASLAGSKAPGVYESVVKQALPVLTNAIMASTEREPWITGAAIELASSLAQGSPESGLGEGFVTMLAPSLFLALRSVEDRDVIQNGIACLTTIVRKDYAQLQAWSDPITGRSGLDCVLEVIAKQLKSQDESGGLVVGDLIIHLLRQARDGVLPVLPELLNAMIGRMITAKTASFTQSLVIPFAFLIHNQRDTVLGLLESMKIDGRSGIDILLQTWSENEETFQGFWAQRISTLAFCSLFVSGRPSVQTVIVKGDLIIKPETRNVIMTRSKTKAVPTEFTRIPFPAKALKILLRELQSGGEAASRRTNASEVDSDDGDDDWQEDDDEVIPEGSSSRSNEMAFLSDLLSAPGGLPFDNDDLLEAADDEDLKNDPVSQMDMKAHLLSFFKDCASHNTNNFSAAVDQLSADEIAVVRQIVSSQ